MIDKLKQIEDRLLLNLLTKPDEWKTLLIDYHPPVVERCWAQIGNYRIYLHFIHKCTAEQALFHPHPWPSAMHVLTGKYEMGLGFGPGLEVPEKMCTVLLENGGAYYDMTHIDGWHYVRPVDDTCATIMLAGKLWDREQPEGPEGLKSLSRERKLMMLKWFYDFYKNKSIALRIIDNEVIEKGDWVSIDESSLNESDRRGFSKFFGMKGFVIGRAGGMIDIRFGNERTQILSKHLILSIAPTVKEEPKKKTEDKVIDIDADDMDPNLWPDDDEDDDFEDF